MIFLLTIHPIFRKSTFLRRLYSFYRGEAMLGWLPSSNMLGILVSVVLIIVVIVSVELLMVILSALYFASVAFAAEGVVKVVAFQTNPVL